MIMKKPMLKTGVTNMEDLEDLNAQWMEWTKDAWFQWIWNCLESNLSSHLLDLFMILMRTEKSSKALQDQYTKISRSRLRSKDLPLSSKLVSTTMTIWTQPILHLAQLSQLVTNQSSVEEPLQESF